MRRYKTIPKKYQFEQGKIHIIGDYAYCVKYNINDGGIGEYQDAVFRVSVSEYERLRKEAPEWTPPFDPSDEDLLQLNIAIYLYNFTEPYCVGL